MKTKRSQEGYLLLDHSNSPGLPPHLVQTAFPEVPFDLIGPSTKFEAPTVTCPHCQTVVVLNPARTRERAWCRRCDAYICDACGAAQAAGAPHRTFEQIIAEVQERAAKALGLSEL